jgi:hypothetical protein
MNKTKYNLSVFKEAAERIDAGDVFCCNRISDIAGVGSPELALFKASFDIAEIQHDYKNATFNSKWQKLTGQMPTDEELRETRLLALCLTHEIARRKNRQGGHAARTKKRAEKRAEKLKWTEFGKSIDKLIKPWDTGYKPPTDLVNGYWKACVDNLRVQNAALRAAAEDFIAKVDSGRARSVDSYAKFKAALEVE